MTVCNEKHFLCVYISMVLATINDGMRSIILKGSFINFAITFDGTPAFAEVVIICVVTKDYHIIELLVKCNFFKHKLNNAQIANRIVKTIAHELGKKVND